MVLVHDPRSDDLSATGIGADAMNEGASPTPLEEALQHIFDSAGHARDDAFDILARCLGASDARSSLEELLVLAKVNRRSGELASRLCWILKEEYFGAGTSELVEANYDLISEIEDVGDFGYLGDE
jgi:hypothetical protein